MGNKIIYSIIALYAIAIFAIGLRYIFHWIGFNDYINGVFSATIYLPIIDLCRKLIFKP